MTTGTGWVVDSVYSFVDTVYMTAAAATLGTRDRLVATARTYLDEHGTDGIGLREIARRAGVSHGTPLRHFPTLSALLSAVAAEGFRDLIVAVDEAVAPLPPTAGRDRLAVAGFGYQRFALANSGAFGLMFRADLCDTTDVDYTTSGSAAFAQLVEIVRGAQVEGFHPDARAEELAGVVWATTHGITSLYLHGALAPMTGCADPAAIQHLANELFNLSSNHQET